MDFSEVGKFSDFTKSGVRMLFPRLSSKSGQICLERLNHGLPKGIGVIFTRMVWAGLNKMFDVSISAKWKSALGSGRFGPIPPGNF